MTAEAPGNATYELTEQRARNFVAGLTWFGDWLTDLLAFGLAGVEADPESALGDAAAKLTDAQLPAPAAALREWIGRVGEEAGWSDGLLAEIGHWYPLCRLGQRLDELTGAQRGGVLGAFGVRMQRAQVENVTPSGEDYWSCIGSEEGESSPRLYYRATYWAGGRPDHWAVQLDYNYGAPPTPSQVDVGQASTFGVRVYPGGLPGRILAPTGYRPERAERPPMHFATWAEQEAASHALLTRQPWRRELPLRVGPVTLHPARDQLLLQDASGSCLALPLDRDARGSWTLLGAAGGGPAIVYGLQRGGRVVVLSAWANQRLVRISST